MPLATLVPMRWTRMPFVVPGTPGGTPAMMTMSWPTVTRPISCSDASTRRTISSVLVAFGTRKVSTPHTSASWLRTRGLGVNASNGIGGRWRATRRAERPVSVKAMTAESFFVASNLLLLGDSRREAAAQLRTFALSPRGVGWVGIVGVPEDEARAFAVRAIFAERSIADRSCTFSTTHTWPLRRRRRPSR